MPPQHGTFSISNPDTLVLEITNEGGTNRLSYRVRNIGPPVGIPFRDASIDLFALFEIVTDAGVSSAYEGHRYPADHCGADLASCPPIY